MSQALPSARAPAIATPESRLPALAWEVLTRTFEGDAATVRPRDKEEDVMFQVVSLVAWMVAMPLAVESAAPAVPPGSALLNPGQVAEPELDISARSTGEQVAGDVFCKAPNDTNSRSSCFFSYCDAVAAGYTQCRSQRKPGETCGEPQWLVSLASPTAWRRPRPRCSGPRRRNPRWKGTSLRTPPFAVPGARSPVRAHGYRAEDGRMEDGVVRSASTPGGPTRASASGEDRLAETLSLHTTAQSAQTGAAVPTTENAVTCLI